LPTKIIKCGCDGYLGKRQGSEFQESAYKGGLRVHNSTSKEHTYRCSVCGIERSHGGGDDNDKKKKK